MMAKLLQDTAIEMMLLAVGRAKLLTEEGNLQEAFLESEEAGAWHDKLTGRNNYCGD
jgi:hypothetical protein